MIKFLKSLFGASPSASYNSPYEGANRTARRAPVPGSTPTDNAFELDHGTRSDLVQASRYVHKNSGLAREIKKDFATYSVGTGLRVKPQAGAKSWKERAKETWDDWSESPSLCGRFTLPEIERMVSQALEEDGEIFIYKTHDEFGNPKVQLIESHRIGPFGGDFNETLDGLIFDELGRVKSYRYLQDNGKAVDLPAEHVIHVFDPERASMARSAPSLSHSTNHLRDEIELLSLEKHAVKANSDVARILRVNNPQTAENEFNPTDDGDEDDTTDPVTIDAVIGGKTVRLRADENLESWESRRPNATFNGFLSHLGRDSALGSLPYEFVADPSKPTGAGVRLVVAKADRSFEWRQEILKKLVRKLWAFVIGDAIIKSKLRAPARWWVIKIGTPRKVTVDAGRERKEDREDVIHGLKNLGDHFDEMGKDFEEEVEQRAAELKFINDMAEKIGVDPNKLLKLVKDTAKPVDDEEEGDDD